MTPEALKQANEISDALIRINDALKEKAAHVLRHRPELLSKSTITAVAMLVQCDLQAKAEQLRSELEAI